MLLSNPVWWQWQWSKREAPNHGDSCLETFLGICFHKGGGEPLLKPREDLWHEKQQNRGVCPSSPTSLPLTLVVPGAYKGRLQPPEYISSYDRTLCPTPFPKSLSKSSFSTSLRVESFFLCPKQQSPVQGDVQDRSLESAPGVSKLVAKARPDGAGDESVAHLVHPKLDSGTGH